MNAHERAEALCREAERLGLDNPTEQMIADAFSDMEFNHAQSEAGAAKLRELLGIIKEDYDHPWPGEDSGTLDYRVKVLLSITLLLESTTAGAETLAELQSLRERLAKAEGERDRAVANFAAIVRKGCNGWYDDQFKKIQSLESELSTARESAEKLAGALEAAGKQIGHAFWICERLAIEEPINTPQEWQAQADAFSKALVEVNSALAALAAHRKGEK